jgi:FlaA1/EpsC-like NDP-sugar epimerase
MLNYRLALVLAFDLIMVLVAWTGGFLIRFNFDWPYAYNREVIVGGGLLLMVQLAACRWAGLYRGMWGFASIPDLRRVLKAVLVSTFALLLFTIFSKPDYLIPRSMVVLYPILLLLLMGGGRVAGRMWKERYLYGKFSGKGKPVVVVGAGTAGAMLLRELARSAEWSVVALIDDDRHKQGLEISGCRVEGTTDQIADVLHNHGARHVILAMPSAPADVLQRITKSATEAGAALFTVPGLAELMSGRVAINMMRPVRIEDLLGRESVHIDNDNVRAMLTGKRILVTGIILLEASEFALYMIEQWFAEHRPEVPIVALAGDVKDRARMAQVFADHQPQVVFHAAAYKHVPLMEVGNAWQAARNNILGTLVVAQAAQQAAAERFVLISTDKAVNPTNVMGATKRMAEMVCEVMQNGTGATRFHVVRFGNVLGSTGSVIPKFQSQIAHGGPITVTHPEINRYFMSIPEAAQLVLQAAAMGTGGEIFVLDMGEPVRIVDLARNMIRLSGFTEDEIPIQFTGLRPGEKLYEELLADAEETLSTPHEKLRIARPRPVPEGFYKDVEEWLAWEGVKSDDEIRTCLKYWIPEYMPDKSCQG